MKEPLDVLKVYINRYLGKGAQLRGGLVDIDDGTERFSAAKSQ